jgi:hypothetical protein
MRTAQGRPISHRFNEMAKRIRRRLGRPRDWDRLFAKDWNDTQAKFFGSDGIFELIHLSQPK